MSLASLKVKELKQKCKDLGLKQTGKKQDLLAVVTPKALFHLVLTTRQRIEEHYTSLDTSAVALPAGDPRLDLVRTTTTSHLAMSPSSSLPSVQVHEYRGAVVDETSSPTTTEEVPTEQASSKMAPSLDHTADGQLANAKNGDNLLLGCTSARILSRERPQHGHVIVDLTAGSSGQVNESSRRSHDERELSDPIKCSSENLAVVCNAGSARPEDAASRRAGSQALHARKRVRITLPQIASESPVPHIDVDTEKGPQCSLSAPDRDARDRVLVPWRSDMHKSLQMQAMACVFAHLHLHEHVEIDAYRQVSKSMCDAVQMSYHHIVVQKWRGLRLEQEQMSIDLHDYNWYHRIRQREIAERLHHFGNHWIADLFPNLALALASRSRTAHSMLASNNHEDQYQITLR